jgi:hypothetical protein
MKITVEVALYLPLNHCTMASTPVTELAEDLLLNYRINGRKSIDDVSARWRIHIGPFFERDRHPQQSDLNHIRQRSERRR